MSQSEQQREQERREGTQEEDWQRRYFRRTTELGSATRPRQATAAGQKHSKNIESKPKKTNI